MRTAIQVLEEAIRLEAEKKLYITNFSFVFNGVEIQYYGIFMAMLFMLVNLMNMSFLEMISIQC